MRGNSRSHSVVKMQKMRCNFFMCLSRVAVLHTEDSTVWRGHAEGSLDCHSYTVLPWTINRIWRVKHCPSVLIFMIMLKVIVKIKTFLVYFQFSKLSPLKSSSVTMFCPQTMSCCFIWWSMEIWNHLSAIVLHLDYTYHEDFFLNYEHRMIYLNKYLKIGSIWKHTDK